MNDSEKAALVGRIISSGISPQDLDVKLTKVKKNVLPFTIFGMLIEQTQILLDIRLPNGHTIQAEVKGKLYENNLMDLFTEEPYFSSLTSRPK